MSRMECGGSGIGGIQIQAEEGILMATYSIGEMAQRLDTSASTIRFYEKKGLLPRIKRDENGVRVFDEQDEMVLRVVFCMKKCGMPIESIKEFVALFCDGNGKDNFMSRYDLIRAWQVELDNKITELETMRDIVQFYVWYNYTASQTDDLQALRQMELDNIPDRMRRLNDVYQLLVPQLTDYENGPEKNNNTRS